MLKREVCRNIAESVEMPIKDVEAVVESFVETVIIAVSEGIEVKIAGLGKFERAISKGREGKITCGAGAGSTYKTEDKLVPKFKATKSFKDLVESK